MHVTTHSDATSTLVFPPGEITGDDEPALDEPYEVDFSENNIAQVRAEVGEYLCESERYSISEHKTDGGTD